MQPRLVVEVLCVVRKTAGQLNPRSARSERLDGDSAGKCPFPGVIWEDVESAAKNVAKAGTPRH